MGFYTGLECPSWCLLFFVFKNWASVFLRAQNTIQTNNILFHQIELNSPINKHINNFSYSGHVTHYLWSLPYLIIEVSWLLLTPFVSKCCLPFLIAKRARILFLGQRKKYLMYHFKILIVLSCCLKDVSKMLRYSDCLRTGRALKSLILYYPLPTSQ